MKWSSTTVIIVLAVVLVALYGGYRLIRHFNKPQIQQIKQQAPSANQQTSPTSSAPVAKNSVQISNFSFSPAVLTVKVGDTVTWTNQDSMGHSATADDKSFDTGVLDQGKSGTGTFSKAGTYIYHCSVHPSMHGKIIVQ